MSMQGSVCISSYSCELQTREQISPNSPKTPETPLYVHQRWAQYRMYEWQQQNRMKGPANTPDQTADQETQKVAEARPIQEGKQACQAPCTSPREQMFDPDENLPEELLDALDARQASGVLLAKYGNMEAEMTNLTRHSSNQNRSLPADARQVALRAIDICLGLAGLDASSRFDAALLLDAHCAVALKTMSVEDLIYDLPAISIAVSTITRKEATQKSYTTLVSLAKVGTKVAEWLSSLGHRCEGYVSTEEVLAQEKLIMASLQWRLGCPTVSSWVNLFCNRFDVLTRSSYSQHVEWVKASALAASSTLAMHLPTFRENGRYTPKQTSQGLWALYLVTAGLVPLQALCPSDTEVEDWEALFLESQQKVELPQAGKMPDEVLNGLLYLLTSTCGCRLDQLKEDFRKTMEQMLLVVRTANQAANQGRA